MVINIAPGHSKSTIISVMFPVWVWIHMPHARWLCASNNISLALRDNMDARRLIESDWFQLCYGDRFQLSEQQNAKMFYSNDHSGYRMATAVKARTTGKRGTHLHIDDPHDAMEGEKDRKAVIDWFGNTWLSRLNDYETGVMIVVGQRIHHADLTGHILKNLDGWEHLNLPTEYEPSRKCFTSIGWSDPRTLEGELLWPEKFPQATINDLKKSLGSMVYAAQYQQSPVPLEGGMFKSHWLRYFTSHGDYYELETGGSVRRVQAGTCVKFITCDLAISEKQNADYTVFAVWGVTEEKDLLLLDVFRDRIDNPTQQKEIQFLYQRYQPSYIVVETVAYQLSFVQQLRTLGLPVREFKPVKDKVARAITASVMYEGGKVYHLKNTAWLTDTEQELLLFPKATHDDVVDNVSMACEQVAQGFSGDGGMIMLQIDEQDAGLGWF
jgi:predicted phage terminase large subunit-like protein